MSEWKKVKLGDLGIIVTGKTPSKKNPEDWGDLMPFVTPSDYKNYRKFALSSDRNLSKDGMDRLAKKVLPIITNQQINSIIPNSDIIDNAFLYYRLVSMYEILRVYGSDGTAVPIINKNDFENLETTILPLKEQKAIAEVLSSLDDKIDLLHRQNKTLEELAQTLFRQWFIEEAKDEWEVGTLGEVINIFDSKRVPLSKMQRDKMKGGKLYPYYGAAKIMDYVNDYIFDGEYILMGEDGTVRTEDGYPILQYATGKFWVNNHTHVLDAKEPYSNYFIWSYLLEKNIDEIVTGAVQPKINQTNLKSLDFPKYPLDLVQRFNEQSTVYLEKINHNKKQIKTLENMRDTLLPKLMSGEVRVEL